MRGSPARAAASAPVPAPVDFVLPPGAEAPEPPERRGLARDAVRLLLVQLHDGSTCNCVDLAHHPFAALPDLLEEGDLLVVNTSATLPAATTGVRADGTALRLHVADALDDGAWVVEPRRPANDGPETSVRAGERIRLPGGLALVLERPHPDDRARRLWRAAPRPAAAPAPWLAAHGRPVRYRYGAEDVRLDELQNVYAREPGSAEMASAGRPITERAIVDLVARGVAVAPVVLHAGVSSPELHEPPAPERYRVPASTARLVRATRRGGGRVVAVGTTVVRALESAVDAEGRSAGREGWTDLVLGPGRQARVVDGLLTGLHPPEASHLLLLEAVAGRAAVDAAYAEAVASGYRWHEFGDAMLFLPAPSARQGSPPAHGDAPPWRRGRGVRRPPRRTGHRGEADDQLPRGSTSGGR